MKTALWTVAGFCAALAGVLVFSRRQKQALPDLANQLQTAWADHHTTA